jgi:hypothetical protein
MHLGHLDAKQSERSAVHSAAFQRATSRSPEIMHVADFDGNNVRFALGRGEEWNPHGLRYLPTLIGCIELPS